MIIRDQFCSVELTNLLIEKYKIDPEKSLLTHGSVISWLRNAFNIYLTVLPIPGRSNDYAVKGIDPNGKVIIDYTDNISELYEYAVDNALMFIFKII